MLEEKLKKLSDSYKDWEKAAKLYAEEHLDLWPFQVEQMAHDWAWRNEGAKITLESVKESYADWISGWNPYSKSHSIQLDGYDDNGQWEHDSKMAQRELKAMVMSRGFDERSADRLCSDVYKSLGDSLGIFSDAENLEGYIKDWISGVNRHSPHHVPLDPENEELKNALTLLRSEIRKRNRGGRLYWKLNAG